MLVFLCIFSLCFSFYFDSRFLATFQRLILLSGFCFIVCCFILSLRMLLFVVCCESFDSLHLKWFFLHIHMKPTDGLHTDDTMIWLNEKERKTHSFFFNQARCHMRTIENVDILVWSFPVLGTNTFVSRIVLICYPARVFLFTKIEWKWCTRLTRTLAAHPNQFNWISSAIWVQMPKKPTWTALTMKCKVSTWYIRFLKSVFFFGSRNISIAWKCT